MEVAVRRTDGRVDTGRNRPFHHASQCPPLCTEEVSDSRRLAFAVGKSAEHCTEEVSDSRRLAFAAGKSAEHCTEEVSDSRRLAFAAGKSAEHCTEEVSELNRKIYPTIRSIAFTEGKSSDSPTLPPQAVPLPSTFATQKQTYGLSDSFPMQTSDALTGYQHFRQAESRCQKAATDKSFGAMGRLGLWRGMRY